MQNKFIVNQKWLLALGLFFMVLQPLRAQITGDDDVCIDQTTPFSFSGTGSSFHWSTPGGTVANPYNIATDVAWTTLGVHDLLLTYVNLTGTEDTISMSVTVHGQPTPIITDSPTLSCSGKDNSTGEDGEKPQCLLACDSSLTHYSTPFSSGSSYLWTVNGDVLDTDPNLNEIDVTWGGVGFATISVIETNQWGCIDSTVMCIEIIESPTAYFGTVQANVGGVVNICSNQSVIAVDSSTNAVSWSWDFGDGFTSSNQSPPAHEYSMPGTYPLTLEVTNACGCTDTYSINVEVDPLPGPDITCASVVCSGDIATYTTSAICAGVSYDWSVDGGVIDSGLGTNTISVTWGDGADGPGLVTLDVSGCSAFCSSPSVVQIPIVPEVGAIVGDSIVCSNTTGTYEIPKVPGTTYEWTVSPGFISGPNNQSDVNIYFGDGLHTLTVVYENVLLGCEGQAVFEINALPQMYISGTNQYCEGDSGVFKSINFNGVPVASNWEMLLPNGTLLTGFSGLEFTPAFVNGPGTYVITATPFNNDACHETEQFIVEVSPTPAIPTIVGDTVICPGSTQQYTGVSTQTGVTFEWSVENGTLNSTSGNSVTVDWNASGPYSISLKQALSSSPFCTSDSVTLDVNVIDNIDITGDTTACTNGTSSFTATSLPFSATYQWEISPSSLGAIVSGQGTDNISIQWLNAGGTATVSLSIAECPTLTESMTVVIDAVSDPTISGTLSFCEGGMTTLTSSEPTGNTWYDDNGNVLGNLLVPGCLRFRKYCS